ncbi:MAG: hypothetical protein Ct9H90mP27_5930 [Gammaproteobacteria bacterium]|nr:MAG: hypothetical protein Ct9H90mP27_5930 [Gammaproteobacteria bacterium]
MTRADFYVLEDLAIDAAYRFACRLCLKAINAGTKVHLHLQDEVAINTMDELMWNYPPERFLPHDVLSSEATKSPVQLGCEEPALQEGLLINLSEEIPIFSEGLIVSLRSSCKIKCRKEEFAINSTVIGVTPCSIINLNQWED